MTPKSNILNIANLLSKGSKGLGVGKSGTIKAEKKDFKDLLKILTSKVKHKSKIASNLIKEEVPVILPFSFSEVKVEAGSTNGSTGSKSLKQFGAKIGIPTNEDGLNKNLLSTISVENKTEVQKDSKNIISARIKKITKNNVNPKTLNNVEKNGISIINSVKNVKLVKNPLKSTNGLGINLKEVKGLIIKAEQSGPLKAVKKGSHKKISLGIDKKIVLKTVRNNAASVTHNKEVAPKTKKNLVIGNSHNKQSMANKSADVINANSAPKIKPEVNKSLELLSIKDSDPSKKSYSISKPDINNSAPLINKIEKSIVRVIAEYSSKPTLLAPKDPDSGLKLKTNIMPKNLSNLASVEKPLSDDINLPMQSKPGNVDIPNQNKSILIRGMRNSVIRNMLPVSASSIGKKINMLQSSAKRAISVVKKKEIPISRIIKTTEIRPKGKQEISQKSVEKNYNNLLNFGNNKSNTLLDSDTKTLFNAQMGLSQEDTTLTKLKTTFVRSGELLDQSKLSDNHLMKFSIKEIDKELGQIQLRLTPRGLGNIKIDLQQDGNVLTAKFLVETPEIVKLLREALPELKETLSQHGINLDESEVSSRKDELAHHFNGKNAGNFEGKQQKNNAHRNTIVNQNVDVPLELLSQKQTLVHRPNSTVEFLA